MAERVNYLKLQDLKKHESCNMTSKSRQFAHVSQANWSVMLQVTACKREWTHKMCNVHFFQFFVKLFYGYNSKDGNLWVFIG